MVPILFCLSNPSYLQFDAVLAGPLNDHEREIIVYSVERSGFGQPARSDLLHFPDTAQQEVSDDACSYWLTYDGHIFQALFGEPQVGSQLMGNSENAMVSMYLQHNAECFSCDV